MTDNKEQSYIEKNRWFITASKLKYFLSYWPEAYKLKYIDELPPENQKREDYFKVWTAFDDLLSYWEEMFYSKYAIKKNLKKDELKALMDEEWIEYPAKALVAELESIYYWDKIMLTESQWESILGMYKEVKRQPLIDFGSNYEAQVEIETTYKWLKLKWTLDRLSLDKKMIRDWKTSWQISYFEYNMDTTFDYIMSMAFYYVLVLTKYNVKCDAVLDVLWTTYPYQYYWYKLNPQQLFDKVADKIKPWLDALIECYETWIWESVYPISYDTEWKHWDIIHHEKWDPISRTKLMQSWYYSMLQWWLQQQFIEPSF